MKFKTKLMLGATALVCIAVTLCGLLMIGRSFDYALSQAEARCTAEQEKAAYFIVNRTIESENYRKMPADSYAATAAARQLAKSTESEFALYRGEVCDYSSLNEKITRSAQLEALAGGRDSRMIVELEGGARYMLLSAPVSIPEQSLTLLSASDVSGVYAARDAQRNDLFYISLAAIAAGALLAALFSGIATKPLEGLARVSAKLADGDYSERANAGGTDEFALLARSFNSMAEAVEERIEQLKESVRQREDFVAALTHEIKTPMTSMLGYASLLQLKEREEGAHAKYAEYIRRETERLEQLSQKLLELMRLKNGDALRFEAAPVAELFAALEKAPLEAPDDVSIEFKADGSRVMCERALVDDMLRNLIKNAVKACQKRGGRVVVRCEGAGERAVVSVEDDGCGIPSGEIGRITEPFYTVDKSRSRSGSGSGIGLALCESIARLHGGSLDIASEIDNGTSVSFTLPLERRGELR